MRVRFNRALYFVLLILAVSALVWRSVISIASYQSTRAAFDKIERGMTPREVDKILGLGLGMVSGGRANVDAVWMTPSGECVIVHFNFSYGVTKKEYIESTIPIHEQLWGSLRASFNGDLKRQSGSPGDWSCDWQGLGRDEDVIIWKYWELNQRQTALGLTEPSIRSLSGRDTPPPPRVPQPGS
jgi:hypothetical protein